MSNRDDLSFPGPHDGCDTDHPHTHATSQPGPTPDDDALRRGWFADWDNDAESDYGWQPCFETGTGHIPCFEAWFKTEAECKQWIEDNVIGVGWL